MKKIRPGFILPSAALTVPPKLVRAYDPSLDRAPRVGDLVYGRIHYVGEHGSLENKHGRIHSITDGSRAVFVYGNRYAPMPSKESSRTGSSARPICSPDPE